jgi:hypothetical protein
VEVEVYRKMRSSVDWLQLEVSYDPSVGYLPRHARTVSFSATVPTYVREFFLIDARLCAAGGFVPTEWYSATFGINDFGSLYPDYGAETVLEPTSEVGVGHFKVTQFRDRTAPVALRRLDGVDSIVSAGGRVALGVGIQSLTLDAIKSRMGRKISNPEPQPLPTLDVAEVQEFREPRPSRWQALVPLALAAVLFSGVAAFMWRRWWGNLVILIVASTIIPGCGSTAKPLFKLSAAFSQPKVLYDLEAPTVPAVLNVRNDGNRSVRLLHVDGGCTCRQVDQSSLPAEIGPSKVISLSVTVSTGRESLPRSHSFTVETDQGVSLVSATLHALPRHQLHPETPGHTALGEDEEWEFEIVHRAIRSADAPRIPGTLEVPSQFSLTQVGSESGRVGLAPEFVYDESTYRIGLKDRNLGLHKEVITVLGEGRQSLAKASVVWQRVPFLSSVPDHVLLGERPVRVFLRCPDDAVELTNVRSTPDGIKAVVTSTREVTVSLREDAPAPINGFVEVETSASDRPPLSIHVVRFQPLARHAAERKKP